MNGTNVLGLMYQISQSVQLAKFHMIYFYVGRAVDSFQLAEFHMIHIYMGHAVVMIHKVNNNCHSQLESS
jgi:hypothetical protein